MPSLGFTGTRAGMTDIQKGQVAYHLKQIDPDRCHHGGAEGADEDFHRLVADHLCRPGVYRTVDVWPGDNDRYRFWMDQKPVRYLYLYVQLPKLPLDRNVTIIERVETLIACPRTMVEERRSGTWHTIRRAREHGRHIWIMWPDGKVTHEPGAVRQLRLRGVR